MMKKTLIATTALVSVAWAGSTLAQESMVMAPQGTDASLGGYYEFGFQSYSDERPETAGFYDEQKTYADSELFISFGRTSDNGLEYGMDVQMEIVHNGDSQPNPAGGGDDIDEASMYIQGTFGRFVIGNNDHASDAFQTWIGADGSYGQDDQQTLPPTLYTKADMPLEMDRVVNPYVGNPRYNDESKIAYFSPNMSGLRFGASWEDGGQEDAATSYGVSYDIPDVLWGDLTLRAATRDDTTRDSNNIDVVTGRHESTSFGAEHRFLDDFTAILAYAKIDETDTSGTDLKERRIGAGIRYDVSDRLYVAVSQSESEDKVTDQEGTFTSISARYVLAQGLSASLAYNTFEVTQENAAGDEYIAEGTELLGQLEVAF